MQVIIKKDTASMSLDGDAKLGDVMKKLSAEHGIEVPKLLGLEGISEFEVLSAFFDQFLPWDIHWISDLINVFIWLFLMRLP